MTRASDIPVSSGFDRCPHCDVLADDPILIDDTYDIAGRVLEVLWQCEHCGELFIERTSKGDDGS